MSINKFIGIGNITRNAEVRTVGQQQVARFGLAMSERYKKQDGTLAENTEFIDVELWGQNGVFPYLVKGQMVYVEGSLRSESWTGNDGQQKRTTKIRAMSVQLLGSRPQETQREPHTQPAPVAPQYQQQYAPQPSAPAYPQAQPQAAPAPQYAQYPAQNTTSSDPGDIPF